jgi:hypothetical protein
MYGREMADPILPTACDFHVLHAENLRHGTDGFTFPPKEGMLRIFFARKIRWLQPRLNPRTWVPEASMLTTRPLKPLATFKPTTVLSIAATLETYAHCSKYLARLSARNKLTLFAPDIRGR